MPFFKIWIDFEYVSIKRKLQTNSHLHQNKNNKMYDANQMKTEILCQKQHNNKMTRCFLMNLFCVFRPVLPLWCDIFPWLVPTWRYLKLISQYGGFISIQLIPIYPLRQEVYFTSPIIILFHQSCAVGFFYFLAFFRYETYKTSLIGC